MLGVFCFLFFMECLYCQGKLCFHLVTCGVLRVAYRWADREALVDKKTAGSLRSFFRPLTCHLTVIWETGKVVKKEQCVNMFCGVICKNGGKSIWVGFLEKLIKRWKNALILIDSASCLKYPLNILWVSCVQNNGPANSITVQSSISIICYICTNKLLKRDVVNSEVQGGYVPILTPPSVTSLARKVCPEEREFSRGQDFPFWRSALRENPRLQKRKKRN